jgi:Tfp pilus assembly protein PilZ
MIKVMTSEDDRRKRIRVPVQSKIRHSQYQVLGTPVFQENSSIDLSSGGISFETAREYQIGNLVLLEVEVNEEQLKLLVCVAWVKPSSNPELFEVGAELIAVDPVHKRKMQKHLNRILDNFETARNPNAAAKKKLAKKTARANKKKKTAAKKLKKKSPQKVAKKVTAKKVAKKISRKPSTKKKNTARKRA